MRPSLPSRSFRTQLVASTVAVTTLGVLVLTVVVQVVLARSTLRSLDTVLEDRAEAVVSAATADSGGRLVVPDARLDAGVAVYDRRGSLAAGSVPTSERAVYEQLSTTDRRRLVDRPGPDEGRVLAEPFTTPDGAAGVVVVTERLAPYERAERQALYVCIGAGLLMVVAAAGLAQWVSRRALAPVAEMARAAEEWSEQDLGHRFGLGPGGNEIVGLGRTLDRLLERVASAIRSEQRLTSELAHELRTPLAAVQANAELLAMHDDLRPVARECVDEIVLSVHRMGATIDGLLELARTEAAQALAGACVLRDAVEEAAAQTGVVVENEVPGSHRVRMPQALVVRAVAPVLENAGRLAGHVVVSTSATREGFVAVLVDDDGPGIADDDRERVFEPGVSGGGGSGLGLALSRRVARSLGGDVRVTDGPMSTRVMIELPAAT
ncbi:HAMP domain-containing sensor histidine kinase [Nocardioides marinquilinus]|uniref:histidine kinase n=1 Tax=Nocardioides marinquilinus TaxID=1210400 RepID=A0ABP9PCM7_9ACTN